MTKVRDIADSLSDHLLSFLENCHERHIYNVKRINDLEIYSIVKIMLVIGAKLKSTKIQLLLRAREGGRGKHNNKMVFAR